jgi:hypothetical protein
MSTFLMLSLIVAASAQTGTVGISVGNSFTYGVTATWSSNDPVATPPADLEQANETQWQRCSVTAIHGTNVTASFTDHFKNGTETTSGGWVAIDTGAGENMTLLLISANLGTGDPVYTSAPYSSWFINGTSSRTYSSGARLTNNLDLSTVSQVTLLETISYTYDFYWDRSTGILVEELVEQTNQTGAYTTTWSLELQITNSSVWTVPEYPALTQILILIALTSAMMVVAKQRLPKRPIH